MSADSCGGCLHFTVAAEEFEREVPGFKVLSSAFGSVRGDTGLCRKHDYFCTPEHGCAEYSSQNIIVSPAFLQT